MRGPKLDIRFKVWPHQCQVQRENHCPGPAGHTIAGTAQVPLAFLATGSRSAAVDQHPQILFHWATFQSLCPKSRVLNEVVVTKGHSLALGLVELHTIGLSPLIQIKRHPDPTAEPSCPSADQHPVHPGVTCKLTGAALYPLIHII
ncbi:hypothetical protein WISP_55121 [Willisornis vidua]|uniref:Uncharacterized protein n=1 Tax=Willisornis vidua TaxID=1566151 RepID=A0ABQ9DCJ8_9PASS|nr:hypothetical protein WISP_55121 [Willisornis vidua]